MTHDQAVAAIIGAIILVLSATSSFAGAVVATEVPAAVLVSGALFLGGVLVTVLGWMAVTLYQINGTTNSTNELVHAAVSDVDRIEKRLDAHEIALARLQGWPPQPPEGNLP